MMNFPREVDTMFESFCHGLFRVYCSWLLLYGLFHFVMSAIDCIYAKDAVGLLCGSKGIRSELRGHITNTIWSQVP